MQEREATREREREPQVTGYDVDAQFRKEWMAAREKGKVVIKGKDMVWEQNPQGRVKFLLGRHIWDQAAVPDWHVFMHHIQSTAEGITTSGEHRHQGGRAIFCLDGEGYSIVDGVRYDWSAGDLIMLPIKPGGCTHQHFPRHAGQSATWIAFYWEGIDLATGQFIEQRKVSSVYPGHV